MRFSLLSYNTLFNKTFNQVAKIIKKHQPDIICLQEVDTHENNLKILEENGYKLADYVNCFIQFGKIWGIATYYNSNKFDFLNSRPIPMMRSFFEILTSINQLLKKNSVKKNILKTSFFEKITQQTLVVYNVHLSTFGSNKLRLKQINLIDFKDLDKKHALVITGDFNFPFERKKLETIMEKYQLKEATNNLFYTLILPKNPSEYKYGIIAKIFAKIVKKIWTDKMKVDYIFYRGLKNISTKRLDYNYSDHFPVITQFEI